VAQYQPRYSNPINWDRLSMSVSHPDSGTFALDPPAPGEFSIACLPDTQMYSQNGPERFLAQTQWIVAQRERYNIQAVLHEGDVVNRNQPEQWANAQAALRLLDAAEIPYLIAIGNHDYDVKADANRLATAFNGLFPPSRYTAHAWWQGDFFEPGRTDNAYCRLTLNGANYLLLNLEFGPRQAVIDWAHIVLDRFADHRAIVVTHSYLYIDGTHVSPGDEHNPKKYPLGATANDGRDLWLKLVSQHDNVRWVQCGHHVGGNVAYRRDETAGGASVHQLFANWQEGPNDGDGWMQLVTFGPHQARVQTFSPTLGQANTEPECKFSAPL
jgi:hypothetical protein